MAKWKVDGAGPRQTKTVQKALSQFETRAMQKEEIKDWGTMVVTTFQIASGQRYCEGFTESLNAIGEKYAWTITKQNAAKLVVEINDAKKALKIPVVDCRTKAKAGAK